MDKFKRKLYKLEYKYGRYAIHNLMLYVVVTMLAVYFMQYFLGMPMYRWLSLTRDGLMHGQIWRLVTFIFLPPNTSPIWMVFFLYFSYLIGNSLEQHWGAFKFNLYYLLGILFLVASALISGGTTVEYLNLSLFLAFAQLFPDTQFMLFFFIPVKAKWLAWADWALFGFNLIIGIVTFNWPLVLSILFTVANFLLFFGGDLYNQLRYRFGYNSTRNNFRRAMRENEMKNRR